MQKQYFEPAPDAHTYPVHFPMGGRTDETYAEVDDCRPQVQLTLFGPNELVVSAIVSFEADAPAPGAALRLLTPGVASGEVVHTLPLAQLTASTTVALSVAGLAPGRYALLADGLHNFSATAVWLVDAHAGVRINLRQESTYVFTAVAAAPGRFWLHLVPLAVAGHPAGSATGALGLASMAWARA
ncbi:hypothetical protein ACFQ48_04155 [Hymenobacter caeli]|uniref:DUF4397 domain-containing protein n=1 Tax=Hymenobacter caeli TaxID=2735894 RepID=A0ABX2FN22_9BACT|nr:hypothetical protein [Hymenobacter caeli]NRT17889.1 hypothetical protein [Hymenobacter caeli]